LIDETFQNALLNVMILAFLGLQKEQIIICLELLNQEGIIGGADSYKRYTLRTNIKSQVKDWLEVGANISYSNTGSSPISEDDSTGGVEPPINNRPINSCVLYSVKRRTKTHKTIWTTQPLVT
jgi:hypothetical protein